MNLWSAIMYNEWVKCGAYNGKIDSTCTQYFHYTPYCAHSLHNAYNVKFKCGVCCV